MIDLSMLVFFSSSFILEIERERERREEKDRRWVYAHRAEKIVIGRGKFIYM